MNEIIYNSIVPGFKIFSETVLLLTSPSVFKVGNIEATSILLGIVKRLGLGLGMGMGNGDGKWGWEMGMGNGDGKWGWEMGMEIESTPSPRR